MLFGQNDRKISFTLNLLFYKPRKKNPVEGVFIYIEKTSNTLDQTFLLGLNEWISAKLAI